MQEQERTDIATMQKIKPLDAETFLSAEGVLSGTDFSRRVSDIFERETPPEHDEG